MKIDETDNKLEILVAELEKMFRHFKKVDIFKAVSDAYKKVHPFMHLLSHNEIQKIKDLAITDLTTG